MTVSIEKNGSVWTVIHDRPEARNAMHPYSADALTGPFLHSTPTRARRSPS
jgi:enoyl-CoA hydratase